MIIICCWVIYIVPELTFYLNLLSPSLTVSFSLSHSQIVWAQTCNIGCAVAYCPRPTGYAYKNIYLLVCNYAPGPPSDYIYRRPYRPGDSCSNCGNFYTECENNLCCKSPLSRPPSTFSVVSPPLSLSLPPLFLG